MLGDQKPKRILIVDDDPVLVQMLDRILKEKGYEVWKTSDAPEGLQWAITKGPDLIILDVMMPIINGYNFCKLLKDQETQKHIPIIMLTSRDEKEDMEIGREVGADAYLTKPLNTEELLKTITDVEGIKQER